MSSSPVNESMLCMQAYEKSVRELKTKLKTIENEHELLKLELQSRSVLFVLYHISFFTLSSLLDVMIVSK